MLVDTAQLLILGSFFELRVRIIHEKIRYFYLNIFIASICSLNFNNSTLPRHLLKETWQERHKFNFILLETIIESNF